MKNKDVDLVVSGVDPPPATSTPGGVFVQGDRAWNSGTGDAPASSTTRYLLSRDKSRSARDLRLDGSRIVPALAAGAEHAGSASLTVPATAAGDYYVLACVDFPKEIAERNEENNCRASPSRIAIS